MSAAVENGIPWTAIATLVTALATLVLAGIALFEERLRQWLSRARLHLSIVPRPPDTHQIEVTYQDRAGNTVGSAQAIYVRARVSHEGGPPAENVEVIATHVFDVAADGSTAVRRSFLPLSLLWSHFGGVALRVPADSFRLCDVGHFARSPSGETVFVLSTIVHPNPVAGGATPSVLPAGSYEIKLLLTGDNAPSRTTTWRLTFPSRWSDVEDEMLEQIDLRQVDTGRERPALDMPIVFRQQSA